MNRLLVIFVGAFALLSLRSTDSVMAQPVSVAFEATVYDVVKSPSTTITLDVESGDVVAGTFSFEPFFLPPQQNPLETQDVTMNQPFQAFLQVNGNRFHTPSSPGSLSLTAINNAIIIDGPSAQEDRITVGGALVPHDLAMSSAAGTSSEFLLELWGRPSLLDSAGVPGDVAALNEFEFLRHLTVRLVDASGESIVFRATVGNLSVIPEPSSLASLLLSVGALFAFTRGARLRRP